MQGHGSKSSQRKTKKCCVRRCAESKTVYHHLHCVPLDKNRRRAWEGALGMTLMPSHRVCDDHFEFEDYIPTRGSGLRPNLKRTAIPRHFPDGLVESPNPVVDEDELQRREEIRKEFDKVPDDMKVLPEDMPALREEARNLLKLILSNKCREHAASYLAVHGREDSSILDGALGPFALFCEMQDELYDAVQEMAPEGVYPFGKLLTEVIIWSIEIQRNCTREEAKCYMFKRNDKIEVLTVESV